MSIRGNVTKTIKHAISNQSARRVLCILYQSIKDDSRVILPQWKKMQELFRFHVAENLASLSLSLVVKNEPAVRSLREFSRAWR